VLGDISLPDDNNLAALIAMCLCPEAFEPQQLLDAGGKRIPWSRVPDGVELDRMESKRAALQMVDSFPSLKPLIEGYLGQVRDAIFGD
jgi:hypothetical protein